MGIPFTAAHGSIRFSLSRFTTEEEVDYTLSVMPEIVERLLEISPFWDSAAGKCRPVTI
jgi:cysteine desulfurase